MPSNAQLAAKLLRNAAEFFRSVGAQDSQIGTQMQANADTYEMVAEWVERDAHGEGPGGEGPGGKKPESEARSAESGGRQEPSVGNSVVGGPGSTRQTGT